MTIAQIEELIEEGNSLKAIATAYSDIANLKIRKIRQQVERNRKFFEEMSTVYSLVKAFALKKKITLPKPKKRLAVLITSNYRFYGQINTSLIYYFVGSTEELKDVDKIIIGKVGMDYFKASKNLPNFQGLMLEKDMPNPKELTSLVNIISQYNQVQVFYSQLKSLLVQRATFADITATSFYTSEFQVKHFAPQGENPIHFIFEPELTKILQFFDNQILTLLLEQTFFESELSRTASRFITMDQAETEANKFIKENLQLKAYIKRSITNNQLLESIDSIEAIRKKHHVAG